MNAQRQTISKIDNGAQCTIILKNEIKFGIYEQILNEYKFDELKVVCTMGR